jgi:hypothetical protein
MQTPSAALCLVSAMWLAGCGETPDAAPASGTWRQGVVTGLAGASDLAVLGDTLLAVCGGGDRHVYAISADTLRTTGTAVAQSLALRIPEVAPLDGSDELVRHGYRVGHVWRPAVDLQAVGAQPPDRVFVGDRARRVVFWGPLLRGPDGTIAHVGVQRAFVPPGADRSRIDEGDWRDQGPGMAGLLGGGAPTRTEDVYVLDRGVDPQGRFLVWKVDRFGARLGEISLEAEGEAAESAQDLAWTADRFYLLHGGRGQFITPFALPALGRTAALVGTLPAPRIEGAARWTGIAADAAGRLYLLSDGDPAVVAWREP